jgi:hypothetical protein
VFVFEGSGVHMQPDSGSDALSDALSEALSDALAHTKVIHFVGLS